MIGRKKYFNISLRCSDELDLIKGIDAIKAEIIAGKTNHSSGKIGDVSYDWHYKSDGYSDWREEEINGKWCQVYPSKMNSK